MTGLKKYRWNGEAVLRMSLFVKLLWKAKALDAKRFREAEYHLVEMKNDALIVDVLGQIENIKGTNSWYSDGGNPVCVTKEEEEE